MKLFFFVPVFFAIVLVPSVAQATGPATAKECLYFRPSVACRRKWSGYCCAQGFHRIFFNERIDGLFCVPEKKGIFHFDSYQVYSIDNAVKLPDPVKESSFSNRMKALAGWFYGNLARSK